MIETLMNQGAEDPLQDVKALVANCSQHGTQIKEIMDVMFFANTIKFIKQV